MVESKFNDIVNNLRFEHLTDWHGVDYSKHDSDFSIEDDTLGVDYKEYYIPYTLYITGNRRYISGGSVSPDEYDVKVTAEVKVEEVIYTDDGEEFIISPEQQDKIKIKIEEIIKHHEE